MPLCKSPSLTASISVILRLHSKHWIETNKDEIIKKPSSAICIADVNPSRCTKVWEEQKYNPLSRRHQQTWILSANCNLLTIYFPVIELPDANDFSQCKIIWDLWLMPIDMSMHIGLIIYSHPATALKENGCYFPIFWRFFP